MPGCMYISAGEMEGGKARKAVGSINVEVVFSRICYNLQKLYLLEVQTTRSKRSVSSHLLVSHPEVITILLIVWCMYFHNSYTYTKGFLESYTKWDFTTYIPSAILL